VILKDKASPSGSVPESGLRGRYAGRVEGKVIGGRGEVSNRHWLYHSAAPTAGTIMDQREGLIHQVYYYPTRSSNRQSSKRCCGEHHRLLQRHGQTAGMFQLSITIIAQPTG